MKMEKFMLSVIIPVYNVEKYLRKCVDSVLAQDIADMEVILIDDGSPDNCGAICDEYAEKDARVKVIHKENGGAATARNVGLDIARGKYITFVDSDDYLLPNTFIPNLDYIKKHPEVDYLQFPMIHDDRIEFAKKYTPLKEERTLIGNDIFINWWDGDVITYCVCGKIFKREIFSDLRFPQDDCFEDAMIVAELSKRCNIMHLSMNKGYYYHYTEGSRMNSTWTKKKHMDFLKYRLLIWERTVEEEDLKPVIIGAYLRVLIVLAWCYQKGFVDFNEYGTFLDSMPSIRLLPKSKKLGIKRLVGFIVIKMIGTRAFLGLYKRLKGS